MSRPDLWIEQHTGMQTDVQHELSAFMLMVNIDSGEPMIGFKPDPESKTGFTGLGSQEFFELPESERDDMLQAITAWVADMEKQMGFKRGKVRPAQA